MMPEKERCPSTATEAPEIPAEDHFDNTARSSIGGVFVAVVQTGNETVRRRVYLSLAPAQTAVQRARAAGIRATLVVAELLLPGDGDRE